MARSRTPAYTKPHPVVWNIRNPYTGQTLPVYQVPTAPFRCRCARNKAAPQIRSGVRCHKQRHRDVKDGRFAPSTIRRPEIRRLPETQAFAVNCQRRLSTVGAVHETGQEKPRRGRIHRQRMRITPLHEAFCQVLFKLLTQIIVKVRKCKVQRVCVLHFQLAGSGGFFLMKLYH